MKELDQCCRFWRDISWWCMLSVTVAALQRYVTYSLQVESYTMKWKGYNWFRLFSVFTCTICIYFWSSFLWFTPAIFTSGSLLHSTYYIFFYCSCHKIKIIRSRHKWNIIGLSFWKIFVHFFFGGGGWQFSRLSFPNWSLVVGSNTYLLQYLKTLPVTIDLKYLSTL